ncbi:MAG: DUF2752 domain-containing protein [Coprococcus sp.]|nr:DUF2752 domain-containing protein [Coprococcus sp.]
MKKKRLIYLNEPEKSIYIAEIITVMAITVLTGLFMILCRNVPAFADMMTCKFKEVSGLPCPSCGGTRAVICLLHGQILKSLYYHAAVIYIVVLCVIFFVSQSLQQLTKGRIRGLGWHNWYWIAGLAIYIVQYILKLAIPGYKI